MTRTETVPTEATAGADAPGHDRLTAPLLVTLALLSAAAPLATDMYLPSFPEMVTELQTSTTGVQLSLTSFFIGAGLGQLLFGPLSDRIGRLRPLLAGAIVYVAASALAALAPSIGLLIAARFVQGLSGAAGMVVGRAMVSDMAHGRAAARAFSLLMLVGGIAPVLAPVLGSVLAGSIGWRGILWVVTGVGVLALAAALLVLRETRPPAVRATARRQPVPVSALFRRRFLGNALAFAFAFATMMAYISASPFLYQTMMGLDEVENGLLFGLNALTLTVVGGFSARLTRRHSPVALARTGLLINLVAIAVLAVLVVTGAPAYWLAVPLPFAVGALGLVFGNATALALDEVKGAGGMGSAVLGLLQFVLAGSAAPLVGLGGGTTAIPLAATMLVASLVANAAFLLAGHRLSAPASVAGPDAP
ncbi:multidrug effflux MFS transporter [Propionicicella superfundia]|uniref:multidrug effflux MFS transporter n=1 Tax=Propionicicella superfundia TaxID=348582 RepID=UPI0004254E96|nr:multidrug effflux MFS transporter [Propionicicella superfundia]